MARIAPEQHVRAMIRMCFGDPRRVPRARIEQAIEEMRERAEQPWADRALTRSMRGLMTSYLRVGGTNAWQLARSLRMPTLVLWGDKDRLVDPGAGPPAGRGRSRTLSCTCWRASGTSRCWRRRRPTARAVLGLVEGCDEGRNGGYDAGRDVPTSRAAADTPRSVRP